jgi:hypothetical protein
MRPEPVVYSSHASLHASAKCDLMASLSRQAYFVFGEEYFIDDDG